MVALSAMDAQECRGARPVGLPARRAVGGRQWARCGAVALGLLLLLALCTTSAWAGCSGTYEVSAHTDHTRLRGVSPSHCVARAHCQLTPPRCVSVCAGVVRCVCCAYVAEWCTEGQL
jgi:hypothetical protein